MMRTDILTDIFGDNDLLIQDGDFVVGESDIQHAQHIIEAEQGHYKQWPLIGVGARRMLGGTADAEMRRAVQLQLVGDGHVSPKVGLDSSSKITVRL